MSAPIVFNWRPVARDLRIQRNIGLRNVDIQASDGGRVEVKEKQPMILFRKACRLRPSQAYHTPLDLRLLSIGTLAYGGVVALSWVRQTVVYIPATMAVAPLLLLTSIGIAITVLGLLVKGLAGFYRAGLLMVASFVLGFFGLLDGFWANADYTHTADVC